MQLFVDYFKNLKIDFNELANKSFPDENLFDLWYKARPAERIKLISSKGENYFFGPPHILYQFESFIKNYNYKTIRLELQMSHDNIIHINKTNFDINCINFCYKQTKQLSKHIPIKEKINLFALPKTWMYLLNNDYFLEFLHKYQDYFYSLITTDYPSNFKKTKIPKSIFINDNCIDWKNGVNFYSCKYGNKHTVPCYLKTKEGICNLLNLCYEKTIGPEVDYIEISNNICECKKPICIFKSRNIDDPCEDIIDNLKDEYVNLQFNIKKEIVEVFYIKPYKKSISFHDEEIIQNKFKNYVLHKESGFYVGTKMPTWWYGDIFNFKI